MSTQGVDVVLAAYAVLGDAERDAVFDFVREERLRRRADEDGETARHIRSLRRVAEHVGRTELSSDEYRRAYRQLRSAGEDLIEISALIRYFGGRWIRAKEALALSATETPLKIEARFRSRLVGKVHRYRDDALRDALVKCAKELGHPPLVVEYAHWRQKEIEIAKLRGQELWLPSDSPYRRRWGSWEAALIHHGFDPEEVWGRLDPGRQVVQAVLRPHQYKRT